MGRQRTVDDDAIWRSTKLAGRTQEDRATLLYLLTSPFSNIIGVYPIVPRIAASEMGWDTDSQLVPVLKRLSETGFIDYDAENNFVWVKIWWDHNSVAMAVGPKIILKTYEQIGRIPEQWRDNFVSDFLAKLQTKKGKELRLRVENDLRSSDLPTSAGRDEGASIGHPSRTADVSIRQTSPNNGVSVPHGYPIDSVCADLAQRLHISPEDSNGTMGCAVSSEVLDGVPIGYRYRNDRDGGNDNGNGNGNSIKSSYTTYVELKVPACVTAADQAEARRLLSGLPHELAQALIDEWAMRISRNELRERPIKYLVALLNRLKSGAFHPSQHTQSNDRHGTHNSTQDEFGAVTNHLKAFAREKGWVIEGLTSNLEKH
jgi:hypothetical protein